MMSRAQPQKSSSTRGKPRKLKTPQPSEINTLLVELANLRDDGGERFWRKWGTFFPAEDALLALRDNLRRLWRQDTPEPDKDAILDSWLRWPPPGLAGLNHWWAVSFRDGVRAIPHNLRAVLALAVPAHRDHLLYCGRPDCITPFFIGRKGKKYCGEDCTNWAHNRDALKEWHEHGGQRRQRKRQKRRRK